MSTVANTHSPSSDARSPHVAPLGQALAAALHELGAPDVPIEDYYAWAEQALAASGLDQVSDAEFGQAMGQVAAFIAGEVVS